jgi:hypothetical protein
MRPSDCFRAAKRVHGRIHRIISRTLAVSRGADDRRHVIREDVRERREVAGIVATDPKQIADRLLAFGDGIEVAHQPTLTRLRRTIIVIEQFPSA